MSAKGLTYKPNIDGLRAFAVLFVIFYHLDFKFAAAGFVGVDIFFVISGFLITQIIYAALLNDSFSLKGFYSRRIKRIFPALFFVLIFVSLLGFISIEAEGFTSFYKDIRYATLQISNFRFAQEIDYFDHHRETSFVIHTWSLAIEEQFYLLWPLLIMVWFKKCGKTPIYYLFLTIIIFSFAVFLFYSSTNPKYAFYMPYARAWELSFGGLIAVLSLKGGFRGRFKELFNRYGQLIGGIGVALLAVSSFLIDEANFLSALAIFPVLGAGLLLLVASDKKIWINRFLSLSPIVFIGKISYSLYLWHWPLIYFYKYLEPENFTFDVKIILILFSILLAYVTYIFVENPLRYREWKLKTVYISGFSVILVFMLGTNFLKRFDDAPLRGTYLFVNNPSQRDSLDLTCSEEYMFNDRQKCVYGQDKQNYQGIIIGDSHAAHYGALIKKLNQDFDISFRMIFLPGCNVFGLSKTPLRYNKVNEPCLEARKVIQEELENNSNIRYVILSTRLDTLSGNADMSINRKDYSKIIRMAMKFDRNVFYLDQAYYLEESPVSCLLKNSALVRSFYMSQDEIDKKLENCKTFDKAVSEKKIIRGTNLIKDLEQEYGFVFYNTRKHFDEIMDKEGRILYRDADHISSDGARHVYKDFKKIFSKHIE